MFSSQQVCFGYAFLNIFEHSVEVFTVWRRLSLNFTHLGLTKSREHLRGLRKHFNRSVVFGHKSFPYQLLRPRRQMLTGWKKPSVTKQNSRISTMSELVWRGLEPCGCSVDVCCHRGYTTTTCLRLEVLVAHNDQKQTSKLQALGCEEQDFQV